MSEVESLKLSKEIVELRRSEWSDADGHRRSVEVPLCCGRERCCPGRAGVVVE